MFCGALSFCTSSHDMTQHQLRYAFGFLSNPGIFFFNRFQITFRTMRSPMYFACRNHGGFISCAGRSPCIQPDPSTCELLMTMVLESENGISQILITDKKGRHLSSQSNGRLSWLHENPQRWMVYGNKSDASISLLSTDGRCTYNRPSIVKFVTSII